MAIYYTPPINSIPDLAQKKRPLISDPASDVTDVASTCADIIDVLQTYGLVATA